MKYNKEFTQVNWFFCSLMAVSRPDCSHLDYSKKIDVHSTSELIMTCGNHLKTTHLCSIIVFKKQYHEINTLAKKLSASHTLIKRIRQQKLQEHYAQSQTS